MTSKQQWLVVGGVVALLAGAAVAATQLLGDELTQVTVGSQAPPFEAGVIAPAQFVEGAGDAPRSSTIPTDSVRPLPPPLPAGPLLAKTLADYRGQVMLLNIWATWCGPCRIEMPSIEALHRALGPRGLKVVAVSVDEPGKAEDIHAFLGELGLTFETLYDSTGTIQGRYRTTGVPETFVIGRDGTIRRKWIGPEDWNSPGTRRLIEQLLAEKAP